MDRLADRAALFREVFPRDGLVVEVGSQRGVSAVQIVEGCAPRALILVDVWRLISGEYERDPANRPDAAREREMQECARRVGRLPTVLMLRLLSKEAAPLFTAGSLDAVYLDANHTREGIESDLALWYPKVKPGGILAGHDYTTKLRWVDVKPAVDRWAIDRGLGLIVTEERTPSEIPRPHPDVDGCVFASWAVVKP